jgi:hypothetical protein
MKASELRIGNYLTEDGRLIHIHDGFGIDHAHNFKPIEITNEWLLDFGFVKGKKGWSKTLNNKRKFNLYMHTSQFIHQLQNLYFALTGEELTLKK